MTPGGPAKSPGTATPARGGLAVFFCGALIALAAAAAYHNSFHGPFVFDDVHAITENPSIRRLSALGDVLSPPLTASTAQGRPILNLSLAVNYAISGTHPAGYHCVNLLIHVAGALAVFGVVRRTLLMPTMRGRFGAAALPLALAASILWAVHPLQTEAVTYIIQRAESLMALFYLLTLYCFIRGVTSTFPVKWWAASVAACLLGMGTKEDMASAPIMVLLYDCTFAAGTLREALRRRWGVFALMAATWIPLAYLVASGGGNRGGSVGFGVRTAWWAYSLTQGEAILHYLRLCFWPAPLAFDYGTFWIHDALTGALWTIPVLLLVAAVAVAWRRAPAAGYAGLWFLAILAPTSLIPGTTQMIVEHRMYLPLAAVISLVVVGAYAGLGRRSLWLWPLPAIVLCGLTIRRNNDYRSEESLWADTVSKRPLNAVAHYNLGHALEADPGRRAEATAQFEESLRLDPGNADAHDSLGLLLEHQPGRLSESLAQYREAIRLKPSDAKARNNLGNALTDLPGQLPEAIAQLREAERLQPGYPEIHLNLAHSLAQLPDRLTDAVAEYQEALRLSPDAITYTDLGALLTRIPGRKVDGIAAYREALRLDPGYARAHNDLGSAMLGMPGQIPEALAEFREAIRLKPAYAAAHTNLGSALAAIPGRLDEAIAELRLSLRLNPDILESHYNLGIILAGRGDSRAEAEGQFEEVLRLRPGFEPARQMLEQLRAGR